MADEKISYKTIKEDDFGHRIKILFENVPVERDPDTGKVIRTQNMFADFEKVMWTITDKDGKELEAGLRYGDNPDQGGSIWRPVKGDLDIDGPLIHPDAQLTTSARLIQSGKHPGMTNMADVDWALVTLQYLPRPTAVIMKHNNPCGVATAPEIARAYLEADNADRLAAFGGAVVLNRPLTKDAAEVIVARYTEVLAVPSLEPGTTEILKKRKNLRVLEIPGIATLEKMVGSRHLCFRGTMDGGFTLQLSQVLKDPRPNYKRPTKEVGGKTYTTNKDPTDAEWAAGWFGLAVEQSVSSNSVIYVRPTEYGFVTVGIGTGEQDRVGVARAAKDKAYEKAMDFAAFNETGGIQINDLRELDFLYENGGDVDSFIELSTKTWKKGAKLTGGDIANLLEIARSPKKIKGILKEVSQEVQRYNGGLKGAVTISDGLFPFADGALEGLREVVSCIFQPGGSDLDHHVIEAVNRHGASMVFTNQRYFRHG